MLFSVELSEMRSGDAVLMTAKKNVYLLQATAHPGICSLVYFNTRGAVFYFV